MHTFLPRGLTSAFVASVQVLVAAAGLRKAMTTMRMCIVAVNGGCALGLRESSFRCVKLGDVED
jgi:hypothetical protein